MTLLHSGMDAKYRRPRSIVWKRSFFFSSRRRHTRFKCDWSSDVCSSDLVDDKHELLHLMRRVLEDEQYQVSILQEGRDAFAQMKTQLPDLLILDLRLGDISCQDVLKQLKNDPETAEIPIIVYPTAVLEAEEVTTLVSDNPERFQDVYVVQKPFELENLLILVQQALHEPVS